MINHLLEVAIALKPKIDAVLVAELERGYTPIMVAFPLAGKMRGCRICWRKKPPFRIGQIWRRDEKTKQYVWTVVQTCEKCGSDDEKMAILVSDMMKLHRIPGLKL